MWARIRFDLFYFQLIKTETYGRGLCLLIARQILLHSILYQEGNNLIGLELSSNGDVVKLLNQPETCAHKKDPVNDSKATSSTVT